MAFISNIEVNEQEYGVRAVAIPTGTVDSTSTSTAFTATVPGVKELRDGVCCFIKNGKVTSASGCTLNINGLGAKPIYNSMAAASAVTTTFNTAYTMLFVYDSTRVSGGCWVMYYGYSAGYTNNVSQGQGYATCSTAVGTAAKTAALSSYALVAHGICSVLFTNGNTAANPTLNINGKGAKAIYYKGAACPTNLIKAGDIVTMIYNTQYHIVSIYSGKEYAPLESPEFTGTPTAPTPTSDDNSSIIPNTGWVQSRIIDSIIDAFENHINGAMFLLYDGFQNDNTVIVKELFSNDNKNFATLCFNLMNAAQTYLFGIILDENDNIKDTFPLAMSYAKVNSGILYIQGVYKNKIVTIKVTRNTTDNSCNAIVENIYDLSSAAGAMHFKGSAQQTLTDGGTENASSSVAGSEYLGDAGDVYLQYNNTSEEYVWTGSVWEKLGRDDLPTASTITPGIVKLGASGGAATYEHTHGTLNNDGTISATATAASGDGIIMVDASDHDKLVIGPLFGTATNTYLCNDGTWKTPTDSDTKVTQNTNTTVNSNLPILLGYTPTTGATTNTVNKAAGFYYNPSTKKLYVNSVEAKLTDTNNAVAQNAAITNNGDYPILLGNSTATTLVTASVNKASTLTFNPSTKVLKVNGVSMEPITWTVS